MNKVVKILLKGLVLTVVALAILVTATPAFKTYATIPEVSISGETNFQENYSLNTILEVPKLNLVIDGEALSTRAITINPNGMAYEKNKIELDIPGKYIVEYRAIYQGKTVKKEYSFQVLRTAYSVTGKLSSVNYGKPEAYPDAPSGLVVKLMAGDSFTFNKVVDLNNYTDMDSVISFYTAPLKAGEVDVHTINLRFTDVYDSSKYIFVRMYSFPATWGREIVYTAARSEKQMLTGMEWNPSNLSNPKIIKYNDRGQEKNVIIHQNNDFGTALRMPMDGKGASQNVIVGSKIASLSWDLKQKQLFGGLTTESKKEMIADFDSPILFDELWEGFTTGEVYISIAGSSYIKDSFNFVITEIDGQNLEQTDFVDDSKPRINVDFQGYEGNIPKALTGKSYNIFDASAVDEYDGQLTVNTKVYYNYRSLNRAEVQLNSGAFTPHASGIYTIVYKAIDLSGNITTVNVDVVAVSDVLLSGNLDDYSKTGIAGQEYLIPKLNLTGAKGRTNIIINIHLKDNPSVTYDLSNMDSFIPLYRGTHVITYHYNDYVESKKLEIEVDIEFEGAYLVGEINLPKYFIRNAEYDIPQVDAYSYSGDNFIINKAKVFVYNDNLSEPIIAENGKLKVFAKNRIRIVYSPTGNANGEGNVEHNAIVKDTGYGNALDMSKYFQTQGIDSNRVSDGITFTANLTDNYAEFINRLLTQDFKLVFSILEDKNNFNSLDFYLTDSLDENNTLKFSYKKGVGNTVQFSVNDKNPIKLNGSFGSNDEFMLSFDKNNNSVSPGERTYVKITQNLKGNVFKGFNSSSVMMRFEINGASSGQAAIKISNICGQAMSNQTRDRISPVISAPDIRGEYALNSVVRLTSAYSLDVLDPNIKFTMTVTDPLGNIVTSLQGIKLDESANPSAEHSFVLNSYGIYIIAYRSQENNSTNRAQVFSYNVVVVDSEPPIIIIGEKVETGKVGERILVAPASAEDNLGGNLDVLVFVQYPDFTIVRITDGGFVPDREGKYCIYYSVYDSSNNMGMSSYWIKVER